VWISGLTWTFFFNQVSYFNRDLGTRQFECVTDHGSNMELFWQLDWMSFSCPAEDQWFWEQETLTTARRVKAARFIYLFYKTYSNLLFSTAFFHFQNKFCWNNSCVRKHMDTYLILSLWRVVDFVGRYLSISALLQLFQILLHTQYTKLNFWADLPRKKNYLKIHSLSMIWRKHFLQRTLAVKSYSRSSKFGLIMVDFKVILWRASN